MQFSKGELTVELLEPVKFKPVESWTLSTSSSGISGGNAIGYVSGSGTTDAVGYVNLDVVFPDQKDSSGKAMCSVFSHEEDGFNQGRIIGIAGDDGTTVRVFGKNVNSIGFSVAGCEKFTSGKNACLPKKYQFSIVCLLPPAACKDF